MGKRKTQHYEGGDGRDGKRVKRQWTTPKQDEKVAAARKEIEPGDVGIWATCNRGREGKCVAELKDLFQEYAEKLYQTENGSGWQKANAIESEDDVGAEIEKELDAMRKPETQPLLTSIRLDTPCLVFFRATAPVEPVSFVHKICEDAAASAHRKQSRSVKRLTPVTMTGKATEAGLAEVAQQVLAPHFHDPAGLSKKFAIRSTIRNHSILTRDAVIKQVASLVGPGHSVDLKAYDCLILVDIYKNICGMCVVGSDFDKLKKYNLAEIFEPTSAPVTSNKAVDRASEVGGTIEIATK